MRPGTTAFPACWAMGTNELKQCTVRKKIFCCADKRSQGRTKISCTGTKSPTNQPRKGLLSFVLFIASVSAVSKGHPALVSVVLHAAPPPAKMRRMTTCLYSMIKKDGRFMKSKNIEIHDIKHSRREREREKDERQLDL